MTEREWFTSFYVGRKSSAEIDQLAGSRDVVALVDYQDWKHKRFPKDPDFGTRNRKSFSDMTNEMNKGIVKGLTEQKDVLANELKLTTEKIDAQKVEYRQLCEKYLTVDGEIGTYKQKLRLQQEENRKLKEALSISAAQEGSSIDKYQDKLDASMQHSESLEDEVKELRTRMTIMEQMVGQLNKDLASEKSSWKNPLLVGQVLDNYERSFVRCANRIDTKGVRYNNLGDIQYVLNNQPPSMEEGTYAKLHCLAQIFCERMGIAEFSRAVEQFYSIKELRLNAAHPKHHQNFTVEYIGGVLDSVIPNVAARNLVRTVMLEPAMDTSALTEELYNLVNVQVVST
jgi:hypothetical protein